MELGEDSDAWALAAATVSDAWLMSLAEINPATAGINDTGFVAYDESNSPFVPFDNSYFYIGLTSALNAVIRHTIRKSDDCKSWCEIKIGSHDLFPQSFGLRVLGHAVDRLARLEPSELVLLALGSNPMLREAASRALARYEHVLENIRS